MYFDIKFACLSKYNIEHANSFDSGVFYLFLIFFPFYCSFLLNKDMERRFYPWTYLFTVRYTGASLSYLSLLCSSSEEQGRRRLPQLAPPPAPAGLASTGRRRRRHRHRPTPPPAPGRCRLPRLHDRTASPPPAAATCTGVRSALQEAQGSLSPLHRLPDVARLPVFCA
jgi:hypothetical protein